ncbi:hypothetical protein BaRGS_00021382, partial [Batillaria attramentaria]
MAATMQDKNMSDIPESVSDSDSADYLFPELTLTRSRSRQLSSSSAGSSRSPSPEIQPISGFSTSELPAQQQQNEDDHLVSPAPQIQPITRTSTPESPAQQQQNEDDHLVSPAARAPTAKKKPPRPCVFCGTFQSQLVRHIKRKHGEEESVQAALKLPQADQQRAFESLRKEGIYKKNVEIQEKNGHADLIRERKQGNSDIVMCSGCKGFFSKRRICKHKKYHCSHSSNPQAETVNFTRVVTPGVSEEFQREISDRFRDDESGHLCKTDKVILLLGQRAWAKSAKKERRVIMGEMRMLANLILQMRVVAQSQTLTGEDVINRSNFDTLTEAIQNLTKKEHSGEKSGLKLALGYSLKKTITVMKGHYTQLNEMDKATEVERFQAVLDLNWDFIFYAAQLACERRRNMLRKPQDMPLEEDVQNFRDFIVSEIEVMLEDVYKVWDYHDFVQLRNLIVSRLTLYNARHGGEPARLTLSEWKEAEEGHWVDPELAVKVTDPLDQALLGGTKLAYQAGKGSRRLVPVLIPNDTVEALRKLVSERRNAGIPESNEFLFPNTCSSHDHVSGYNCIKAVTAAMGDRLKKPNLLIADKFRHRASTLFALLDLPEQERESWYRHMGHSAAINKDVYQCPLAITEMTRVGGFLSKLDSQGKKAVSCRQACTATSDDSAILSPSTGEPASPAPIISASQDASFTPSPAPIRSPSQDASFTSSPAPVRPSSEDLEGVSSTKAATMSTPPDCSSGEETEEHGEPREDATASKASGTVNVSAKSSKKRQYMQWNEADSENVACYFENQVVSVTESPGVTACINLIDAGFQFVST